MRNAKRRSIGFIFVLVGVGAAACAVDSGDDGPDTKPGTHAEKLSDPGIEKLVPIRFVHLLQCVGCADAATMETILRALHAANDSFKAAGIQFAVRSIERGYFPNFRDLRAEDSCADGTDDGLSARTWSTVQTEIQTIYPNTPSNAWSGSDAKTNRTWLNAAETLYGKGEEMVVFLSTLTSCGNGYWATQPWAGRNVVMNGNSLAGEPYKLSHEFGHYFGLNHTWDLNLARDPETDAPMVKADRWDLIYKPGTSAQNPHLFFSSKGAAAPYENSVLQIEQPISYPDAAPDGATLSYNTCTQAAGTITCTLGSGPPQIDGGVPGYTETYSSGAAQLKGMAPTLIAGRGADVISYRGPFDNIPTSLAFADSDILTIRKFIRWDYKLDSGPAYDIKPLVAMSARRPQLGSWDIRAPDTKVDFDADGKRDFGVWVPPTTAGPFGQFIVLLSSQAFSTTAGQKIDVAFGKLGDIPAVADYNGDGKTDVAVFQPGGGITRNNPWVPDSLNTTGYWRWCLTASTPTSTTCGHDGTSPSPVAWGARDTVPLPGLEFDGNTTSTEVAYYRPSNGEWGWLTVGVGSSTRQLGVAGSIPLPGLYDGDSKTDIVTYTPTDATFRMLRSEQTWNTVLSRVFDSKFIPNGTGSTSVARGMGIPVAGMTAPYWIGTCPFCFPVPRRSFSIWFPAEGSWTTLWSPIATGTIDSPCGWGWGAVDYPLGGIDRNADMYSDMAVYRVVDYATNGGVFMKNSTPGVAACNGTQHPNIWFANLNRPRMRAAVVADMTGDGKPELVFVHPDTTTISWATSESNYATIGNNKQIGGPRAVFF